MISCLMCLERFMCRVKNMTESYQYMVTELMWIIFGRRLSSGFIYDDKSEFVEVMMHKIFGTKEDKEYKDRIGAYIIPVKGNEVGVVETPKGYFLLGGGLDADETDFHCIKRECLEESGYEVEIGEKVGSAETYMLHPTIGYFHPIQSYYVGKLLDKVKESVEPDHDFKFVKFEDIENKMYLEMQRWAIEQAIAR